MVNMGFSFLPKEYEFFDLFDKQADFCIGASKQFGDDVKQSDFSVTSFQRIKEIERSADKVANEIFEKLNKTFITPFDREDIYSLAHEFDSVIDLIMKLSNLMRIYQVNIVNKNFIDVLTLIDEAIYSLAMAVKGLRNMKNHKTISAYCVEVNSLENKGDDLRNEAIGQLFSESTDAIYIMKWKDILQTSEKILDQCERVAKIIGSLIVKQA